jgi:hypothetical protein
MPYSIRFYGLLFFSFLIFIESLSAQSINTGNLHLSQKVMRTKGLIALWAFKETAGNPRVSFGDGLFSLIEANGPMNRVDEGPLSGYSIEMNGSQYLQIDHSKTGKLNIHGDRQGVTVCAWVKWTGQQTGFVGGMWNEYQDGGKRQYGLFVSLPHYNGRDQVCGHISKTGKPTPPFPYSSDYSASAQKVVPGEWTFVAFTYDGTYIKSFVNGQFQSRQMELIDHTTGFPGYPEGMKQIKNPFYFPDGMGDNGSDFTVGAVLLKSGMGNFFKGLIGGFAVFDRALMEKEIAGIQRAGIAR